jgi:uncharacterized protein
MRRYEHRLLLRVRLKPKSSRDEVEGVAGSPDGPVITARVRALPQHNEANEALEKLIAGWLKVPRTSVSLVTGSRGRLKTLCVTGDPADLEHRLAERLGSLS